MGAAPGLTTKTALPHWQKRLSTAFVLAAIVRFYPVYLAGTALHDGGLFYRMAQDLTANHWQLPAFTTYNHSQIPFAYPPLAIYLLAGLQTLLRLPLDGLMRWLPPAFALANVWAFFLFSQTLFEDAENASWATLVYALAPQAIGPQIMGGGITRAPGALLAFLFLAAWAAALKTPGRRPALTAGLLAGLLTMTHPEWTLHALIVGCILWLFTPQRGKHLRIALQIAGLGGLIALPWWGSLLQVHGWQVFAGILLAKATYDARNILLTLHFTGEIIPILVPLTFLGIWRAFRQRQGAVAAMMPAAIAIEPRSFVRASPLHMAPAAGLALNWFWRQSSRMRMIALLLVGLAIVNGSIIGIRLAFYHSISNDDLQAIQWSAENLPGGANILILAPQEQEMAPVIEWLPALTNLHSLITPQGSEWQTNLHWHYAARQKWGATLQTCLNANPVCLDNWAAANQIDFDLIYVTTAFSNFKTAPEQPLYQAIASSPEWQLLYANQRVRIYQRTR